MFNHRIYIHIIQPMAATISYFRVGRMIVTCTFFRGGKMIVTCWTYHLNMFLKNEGWKIARLLPWLRLQTTFRWWMPLKRRTHFIYTPVRMAETEGRACDSVDLSANH